MEDLGEDGVEIAEEFRYLARANLYIEDRLWFNEVAGLDYK